MREWQPIETAPKDGRFFLACCEGDCSTRNHWIVRWGGDDFVCSYDAEGLTDVKLYVPCIGYWMPLPEPPVTGGVE